MRVILASESAEQTEQLREAALGIGLECAATDCVPYASLPVRLARGGVDLVLVNVGNNLATALPIIQEASHGQGAVLAVGPSTDSQTVMQILRSGAREYLDQARFRDELVSVLDKLRRNGTVKGRAGRTIAVLSASPGNGVTTVASGLAFALAARNGGQAALVELGTTTPELALQLDTEEMGHSLADLARDWSRMDSTMVRQTAVPHPDGVQLLAYLPETLTPEVLPQAMVARLLVLLRNLYDYSVLDLGHGLHPAALEAAHVAESIVVPFRMDIPSLRLTRVLLRQLVKEHNVELEKLTLVANRYGQSKQVPWRKVEEVVELKVASWVPDDPGALNQALTAGRPLLRVAPRSGVSKRLAELATQLAGALSP